MPPDTEEADPHLRTESTQKETLTQMTFDFPTWRSFTQSFRAPDHEVEVPVPAGRLKVQARGRGADAVYMLRYSRFGRVSYQELDDAGVLALAEGLLSVHEAANRT